MIVPSSDSSTYPAFYTTIRNTERRTGQTEIGKNFWRTILSQEKFSISLVTKTILTLTDFGNHTLSPRFLNRGPDPENGRGSKMLGSRIRLGVGGVDPLQRESPTNTSNKPWHHSMYASLWKMHKILELEDQCMASWVTVEKILNLTSN